MPYNDVEFLAKVKPLVIADAKQSGILPSLTAAQAFLESGKGNSGLTVRANNLFGIKGSYNNQSVTMLTTEFVKGAYIKVNAAFKKYPSWAESIADHSSLFTRLARYKNLRGEKNYITACQNVANDGYATDPIYSFKLKNIIEKYKLYEWDQEANGTTAPTPEPAKTKLPVLQRGQQSDYIYHWQKFLNLNGYQCGNEDGIFGANTESAVKQWQQAHGLKADGIIDEKTWASIGL